MTCNKRIKGCINIYMLAGRSELGRIKIALTHFHLTYLTRVILVRFSIDVVAFVMLHHLQSLFHFARNDGADLVLELDEVVLLSVLNHFGTMGSEDELRRLTLLLDHLSDAEAMRIIKCCVNLIEYIEGSRVTTLNRKNEGQSNETLLTAR